MKIDQICYNCATEKGWEPVSYPVGIWRGICDVCKQEKSLSAPRDYIKKENGSIMIDKPHLSEYYHYTGPKVIVPLVGEDGNAFSIMGRVIKAMQRQLRLPPQELEALEKEYRERATSGNYDNLLRVTVEYVDEPEDDDWDDGEYTAGGKQ
jgi:hypothetical protein